MPVTTFRGPNVTALTTMETIHIMPSAMTEYACNGAVNGEDSQVFCMGGGHSHQENSSLGRFIRARGGGGGGGVQKLASRESGFRRRGDLADKSNIWKLTGSQSACRHCLLEPAKTRKVQE